MVSSQAITVSFYSHFPPFLRQSIAGGAGFNFLVSSRGFAGSGSTASCNFPSGATDSSTCKAPKVLFDPGTAFTIPIVPGVSAAVSGRLSIAAIYSGSVVCSLSFGAGASASAHLGGAVQIRDAQALSKYPPTISAYKQFDLSYSSTPLTSSFTSANATLDATLFLDITIAIEAPAVPITVTIATRFSGSMATGANATARPGSHRRASGQLRAAEAVAHRDTQLWHPRNLDSLATCPSSGVYFSASNAGLLGVSVGPVTLSNVVKGIVSNVGLPSAVGKIINAVTSALSITILPLTQVLPLTANGPVQPLVGACVSGGSSLSGLTGGAGVPVLTSSNSNGNRGGGGSGGGDSSNLLGLISSCTGNIACIASVGKCTL